MLDFVETMTWTFLLWIYVVLLLAGGIMGFVKAGSKASLIASAAFAAPLSLCAAGILRVPYVAEALVGFLLVFFGMRFFKGRKFMPAGMMAILSGLVLVLRFLLPKG